MGDHKKADPVLSLDVDVMILEYLTYKATRALLDSTTPFSDGSSHDVVAAGDEHVNMVNSFLTIFSSLHSSEQTPASLQFRLLLLKFIILYTQRAHHTPTTPSSASLTLLRQSSKSRARKWRNNAPPSSFDDAAISSFVVRITGSRKETSQNSQLRTPSSSVPPHSGDEEELPTILDLLPLFIELTATRASLGNVAEVGDDTLMVTRSWFELVAMFMKEACVEQYKVHGATTAAPVLEAFAWGPCLVHSSGEDESKKSPHGHAPSHTELRAESTVDEDNSNHQPPPKVASSDEEPVSAHANTMRQVDPNSIFTISPTSPSTEPSPGPPSSPASGLWNTIRDNALTTLLSSPDHLFQKRPSKQHAPQRWTTRWDAALNRELVELDSSGDHDGVTGVAAAAGKADGEVNRAGNSNSAGDGLDAPILLFLRSLLDSHPRPLLLQLEEVDGLEDYEAGGGVEVEGIGTLTRDEVKQLRGVAGFD